MAGLETLDLGAQDLETRVREAGGDGARPGDLRLWLRILTIHKLVNNEVRRRLRENFGMSLSRFDLLAQLDGRPEGLRMGDLSRRLMVTTGNITGLVDELVADGLVERLADPSNRRASLAAMTARGRRIFDAAAKTNEVWIAELFSGLSDADKAAMFDMLGRQKADISSRLREADEGGASARPANAPKPGKSRTQATTKQATTKQATKKQTTKKQAIKTNAIKGARR
ncbi:MAG: MarR family winged helix-turn-helix transcriptional regulator [Rhodoblastus sp.]